MQGKSFRDLEVWRESMMLVEEIYHATEVFPRDQIYSLTQQAQRSAVSVPSNIAEGHGRKRDREFAYHVRVARGSLCELETQMWISERLGFLSTTNMAVLNERIQRVGRLLNGLTRYLEKSGLDKVEPLPSETAARRPTAAVE